jgi:hypothetical protein
MLDRSSFGAIALAAALCMASTGARAFDDEKYPNWKGQWIRIGGVQWDSTKLMGRGQRAPLTPEYEAIFEASLADQAQGGLGNESMYGCHPPGMPRTMTAIYSMEAIIMPETTYMVISHFNQMRRIYTDGRDWPAKLTPSFTGYSIGKWLDDDRHGRYDVLEVETRGMRGPRALEPSGLPLHEDNATIVKERIYLDPYSRDTLRDDITTIDHAFTRPWTVTKFYRREHRPKWYEFVCAADGSRVFLGREMYFKSADGYLMPTRKGQPVPDLKFFKQSPE